MWRNLLLLLTVLFLASPAHAGSPYIIGLNGNLTAYDHPWTTTPELVDGLRASGISLVRFPAGMIGNYWAWQQGWIDQTVAQEDFVSPWIYNLQDDAKTYNLSDLAYYRSATGGETVFMLNMLTRDLADSLAMLRQAQSLGIPVHRIELGNEFYFERFSLAVTKFPTAESYALEANQWAAALKAEFPDAQIVAIGNAEHQATLPDREATWNQRVIPLLSGDISAITLHLYPRPDQEPATTYAAILARSELNGYTGDIWVTEWNISDYTGDVKNTQFHGELVTQWLETFATDPRIKLVMLHNITEYEADGDRWIAFWPDGTLTPAGQALADWQRRWVYLPLLLSQ